MIIIFVFFHFAARHSEDASDVSDGKHGSESGGAAAGAPPGL